METRRRQKPVYIGWGDKESFLVTLLFTTFHKDDQVSASDACRVFRCVVKGSKEWEECYSIGIWENNRHFFCTGIRAYGSEANLAPGNDALQIRKTDGMWRRGTNIWRRGGYVGGRREELLAQIRGKQSLKELEESFGLGSKEETSVFVGAGRPLLNGRVFTNVVEIRGDGIFGWSKTTDGSGKQMARGFRKESDGKYSFWRYVCTDGLVDVVTSGDEVVWCDNSQSQSL